MVFGNPPFLGLGNFGTVGLVTIHTAGIKGLKQQNPVCYILGTMFSNPKWPREEMRKMIQIHYVDIIWVEFFMQ